MRSFKLPLIVTAIALVLALVAGLIIVTAIHNGKSSSRQKSEQAQMLGTGVAVATCVVVAPFWFVAAAKVGKRRRAAREAEKRAR